MQIQRYFGLLSAFMLGVNYLSGMERYFICCNTEDLFPHLSKTRQPKQTPITIPIPDDKQQIDAPPTHSIKQIHEPLEYAEPMDESLDMQLVEEFSKKDYHLIIISDIYEPATSYEDLLNNLKKNFTKVSFIDLYDTNPETNPIVATMQTTYQSLCRATINTIQSIITDPLKTILLGHGVGAAVAMRYVERDIVCGSILLDPLHASINDLTRKTRCYPKKQPVLEYLPFLKQSSTTEIVNNWQLGNIMVHQKWIALVFTTLSHCSETIFDKLCAQHRDCTHHAIAPTAITATIYAILDAKTI